MKTTRKITAWLLTLALALTLAPPLGGSAKAAVTLTGSGTSGDPYQIGTAEELKKFRDVVNGTNGETQNTAACAVLTADIYLENEAWTPIGGPYDAAYTGTFDGHGHAITGLNVSINTSAQVYAGLFGFVGFNQPGTVQNVHVSGSVSAESTNTGAYGGGIVGLNYKGTVSNCTYTGAVSAKGKTANTVDAGGIVGKNMDTVYACMHLGGDVSATADGTNADAGGVAGTSNNGSIRYSAHTGGTVTATVTGSGDAYAGGVVGYIYNSSNTQYCFSTGGAVTASSTGDAAAGGVVGKNDAMLTDCRYDSDKVTGLTAVGTDSGTTTRVNGLTTAQFTDPANFAGWTPPTSRAGISGETPPHGSWARTARISGPSLRK